jgi:hypothetical protein
MTWTSEKVPSTVVTAKSPTVVAIDCAPGLRHGLVDHVGGDVDAVHRMPRSLSGSATLGADSELQGSSALRLRGEEVHRGGELFRIEHLRRVRVVRLSNPAYEAILRHARSLADRFQAHPDFRSTARKRE